MNRKSQLAYRAVSKKVRAQVDLSTPERRLVFAVIDRAIQDLLHKRLAWNAWDFLSNDNWCTSSLGVSTEWLKRVLIKSGLAPSGELYGVDPKARASDSIHRIANRA